MINFAQTFIDALSLGSLYALAAWASASCSASSG